MQLLADTAGVSSFIAIPKEEIVRVFRSAVSHFAGMNATTPSTIAESEPIFKKTSH